jgi:hypothetical protein
MNLTTFEKGVQQGQRKLLRKQLEARFGPLSPHAAQRLESLGEDQLGELTVGVLTAQSLQDLGLED